MARLNVDEIATYARRHPGTIRRLLESGDIHGTQPVKGGRWTAREECIDAYLDGVPCEHRQKSNVTDIDAKRASRSA